MVDFHATAHAARLVGSLLAEGLTQVVVVDNSGEGMTRAGFTAAGVRLGDAVAIVEPSLNAGFGAGVNAGMEEVVADVVIVANPDTVPETGAVARLLEALQADGALGIVGPALLEADGSLHQSARKFPTIGASSLQAFAGLLAPQGRLARRYRARNWESSSGQYVDWVSGAFFAVRREAFESIGGFDPAYFMYVEEVDLCWRLSRAGWRAGYVPLARVTHLGGASARAHPYRMLVSRHRSLWLFARRSTDGMRRAALPVVAAGLAVRLLLALSRELAGRLDAPRGGGPGSERDGAGRHG